MSSEEIASLQKYYHCSVEMKFQYAGVMGEQLPTDGKEFVRRLLATKDKKYIYAYMYLSLWLSFLNCVLEGWGDMKLHDAKIDKLIESPHKGELRKFRNAVLHYQKKYWDDRVVKFLLRSGSLGWAISLDEELERWFNSVYLTMLISGDLAA